LKLLLVLVWQIYALMDSMLEESQGKYSLHRHPNHLRLQELNSTLGSE